MPLSNKSLSDRVEDTVYIWAGITNSVGTDTTLKMLWEAQADTTPYPDPAATQLIGKLSQEFSSGPDARILKGLEPSLFADGAPIQTINDLITSVQNAPQPKPLAVVSPAKKGKRK